MNCQHDTLLPNTTMQIQSNGRASRIICPESLGAAFGCASIHEWLNRPMTDTKFQNEVFQGDLGRR